MTTRYYKLPGSNEYVTWDYLHNTLGYSTSATEIVGYKSVVNWGTGAGTGYCTDTTDYEAEWFVQGETGWAGLNGLAWGCNVYPSSATDIKVERSGTESNAASMIFDNVEYWLVESEIGDAWWPRSRWEQQGWAIVEDHVYDFILVDSTTGRITYGVENLTEIEFTPTGYITIDEGNEIVFVEQSPFPIVCIDEGTRTPESVAPDDSFDTELPYYASKLYIVTTNDGQDETLYGWEAEEGTPPVDNTIYMFGFWYDTNANDWTFEPRGGSDYQWMGITSQEDVTKLSDIGIGVSTTNASYGPYGCPTDALVNGNYKFVVLGYYDDLAGTTQSQYSDVNNFYMRSMRRDWVYITEIFLTSSISVNVAFYKVRIEAIAPELGYFNASGTAEALPSNTAIPLYRDGVQIPYENGRQYRARGLYDGDDNLITDNPAYFSFSEQNGNLYFSQSYTSGVTTKYIAFV